MMRGFIYFIACEPLEAVKIGFTKTHPKGRLRALQTGCPSPLRLLAFAPGTVEEEALLHATFEPLHIQGEWFRHELKLKALVAFIASDPRGQDRRSLEESISDVLFAAREFNVLGPSQTTPEYVASAIECHVESICA
jgi:hypothetical protein